jgi:hypothetical protein
MTYVAVDPATCPTCENAEFLLVEHHQHPESVASRLRYLDVEGLRRHLRGHGRQDLLGVINGWTPVRESWHSNGTEAMRVHYLRQDA